MVREVGIGEEAEIPVPEDFPAPLSNCLWRRIDAELMRLDVSHQVLPEIIDLLEDTDFFC